MSKGSGSTRNQRRRASTVVPATERGYSARLRRNITRLENSIRGNKDESLHVLNAQGDVVATMQGKGANVNVDQNSLNAFAPMVVGNIMTHNHPRAIGARGAAAIGHSFSGTDIQSAINFNASEIRAVTPTYTFSLKRPANGWGITGAQALRRWNQLANAAQSEVVHYALARGWNGTSQDDPYIKRADVVLFHKVMRQLAKENGWIYTKKNS